MALSYTARCGSNELHHTHAFRRADTGSLAACMGNDSPRIIARDAQPQPVPQWVARALSNTLPPKSFR